MKKTDKLHQLIQSLTKAEKRSFKLGAAQNTKNDRNNYILLFDAIDKQKVYDEQKLRNKFKGHAFAGNISKTRHLLYNMILRTLRHLNEGKTLSSRVAVLKEDAGMLAGKALYQQAGLRLQKAERMAREGGLYGVLLEILDEQRKILLYTNRQNTNKKQVALAEDRLRTIRYYNREVEFRALLDAMRLLYTTIDLEVLPADRNVLEAMWQNHYLNDERKAETFLSSMYFFEIQALVAQSRFDFAEAVLFLEKARTIRTPEKGMTGVAGDDYIRILASCVMCCIHAGNKSTKIDCLLDQLRWIRPVSRQQATRNFLLAAVLDFIRSLTRGNMENCKVQLFTIKELIQGHPDKLSLDWKIILYYHIAIYYFHNRDFEEVLFWISALLKFEKTDIYPQIQGYSRLLRIMAQYEMSPCDQLGEEVEKNRWLLQRRRGVKEVENVVLNCISQLLNDARIAEQRKAFYTLKYALQNIRTGRRPSQLLISRVIQQWISFELMDEDIAILN